MKLATPKRAPDTPGYPAPAIGGIARVWRERYRQWRTDRDFIAIVAALARLSDRRLAMIGMRRDDLVWHVEQLVEDREEGRRVEREVLAILEHVPERGPQLPGRGAEIRRIRGRP